MTWLALTLQWYFYLLLLGMIFLPLTKKLLHSFFDFGYPFAKTIGILLLTYAFFVLNLLKVAPFTRFSIFAVLFVLLLLNILLRKTAKIDRKELWVKIIFIVFEEIIFLGSLVFLTFIRGQESSIRGLEKFMDFGFINSILRSKFMPPLDMWLSSDALKPNGYPINYYYFGHLTGAILIKLSNIKPSVGYNFILATIFAEGTTLAFSFCANLVYFFNKKIAPGLILIYGMLGSFLINLGGNLHTIYLFTSGYPNENPIPFWQILSWYNPTKYWYPNATRFIPFTIHEFPSYSYVVADLHGHVFDIPFVLLTLAILFLFFIKINEKKESNNFQSAIFNLIPIGFMAAIHYMTNAFDGPIYILLTFILLLTIFGFSLKTAVYSFILFVLFLLFSLPFSLNFSPFVSGIGVNCSPDFLTRIGKIGPFLFEKGNCQVSPFWMLFVLWGFFWISFLFFFLTKRGQKKLSQTDMFVFVLFFFGILLVLIPEFFYIKDIYPAHFRANTMFKLGYQAFIMMGSASIFAFFQIKILKNKKIRVALGVIFISLYLLISLYPFFSFPSYYGNLSRKVELDGESWMNDVFPQDKEIIDFLNTNIKGQPVVLEAQGDSYTDYNRISAYTGLPTVAGWWVHEWLWRGSSDVVGVKIPDIVNLYESTDLNLTESLIKKYHIKYVVVSGMEKEKYKNLYEEKFLKIGKKIFSSKNKIGALYQLN